MRHRADAPNGTMDYLFTKLLLTCKIRGFQQFSLGMTPFAGFRKSEHPSAEERAIDYLMRHLNFIFSYSGLHHFKAKFADSWEPRYLIYQNVLALPQVALALARVSELGWAREIRGVPSRSGWLADHDPVLHEGFFRSDHP